MVTCDFGRPPGHMTSDKLLGPTPDEGGVLKVLSTRIVRID